MKIAVVGAGAMGCLFGARLSLAGHDITMVDVVPAVIDAINQRGLVLEDKSGAHTTPAKALYGKDLTECPELVILFTKTMYSRGALEGIRGAIGPDTWVLSLQNGLGNIELISEFVPRENIIVGTTIFDSDLAGPGHIRTGGAGNARFMTVSGKREPMLEKLEALFNEAGLSCEIVEDIMTAIWEKVAFNSATNSIGSICRLPDGRTCGTAETLELAEKIVREVCGVAAAHGCNASADAVIQKLSVTARDHAGHFPSMAQDVFGKRPTEIMSIAGGVYKKAQEVGMEVPYTETVYRLVRCIEQNYDAQVLG